MKEAPGIPAPRGDDSSTAGPRVVVEELDAFCEYIYCYHSSHSLTQNPQIELQTHITCVLATYTRMLPSFAMAA